MKKLLATCSLALIATAASAAGPVVGTWYDFSRANGSGERSHEARVFISQETAFGTVDGALIGIRYSGPGSYNANGFEVGYSNGFSYDVYNITGRFAVGRSNDIDPNGGGFVGYRTYTSYGVEGSTALTAKTDAFVGFVHTRQAGANANDYKFGVDYAIDKSFAVRAGFVHSRAAGQSANGFTTAVTYRF